MIENLIDDARCENAFGLMMSLNMLIEFGDAFDFTGADFALVSRNRLPSYGSESSQRAIRVRSGEIVRREAQLSRRY